MNYKEFMKSVDKRLSVMSEVEKNEWIHNLARTTKEPQRVAFLNSLTVAENQGHSPFILAKTEIEEWCSKIEHREIYFECSSYETYGEHYWDRDWTEKYSDIFGIGNELYKAFQVAEGMLLQKQYEQALSLYEQLCCMSFPTLDDDTEEWDELELEDLVSHSLVNLDLKQIVLNLMYTTYQVSRGEERAASLYRYFSWKMSHDVSIEEMFTAGPEELIGMDLFMEEWISFLKSKDGDMAGDLLAEACLFQGGNDRLAETARGVWGRHPVLYEYACKHLLNEKKMSECEQLGLEAIRVLPEKLVVRGNIADLAAQAAEQLGHVDAYIECCEAAFYADPTLSHFLRLYELPDYQARVVRAAKYAETLSEDFIWESPHYNKQLLMNSLSKDRKKVIQFFNGEFDDIYAECKKDKTTLGWSSHFKGVAVPLFILLLDKNNKVTPTGQRLIDGMINRLGYVKAGTKNFTDQFLFWKQKVTLTDEHFNKYIVWLQEEVDQRTEAIVGGSYRSSYYKAAELISALGETLESNGSLQRKVNLIDQYKKKYPRRSAFKAEFDQI